MLSSSDDNTSVKTESTFDFEPSEDQFPRNEIVQDGSDSTQDANLILAVARQTVVKVF